MPWTAKPPLEGIRGRCLSVEKASSSVLLEAGIVLRCVRLGLWICRSAMDLPFRNDCNVLSRRWLRSVV